MNDYLLNSDPRVMPFGRYLKSMRRQMEIPIEAVADEMRISVGQLRRIEAEDHLHLPDEVYVKGLLRSYARIIGVDGDDIVDRFVVNRSLYYGDPKAAGKRSGFRKKMMPGWVLFTGFLIIIIILSVCMRYGFSADPPHGSAGKEPALSGYKELHAETNLSPSASIAATNDKLFLQIDATQDTWLKIIIDDAEPVEYLLHPMDHMELEASSVIKMQIGNAAGVKIVLNEQQVSIPGNSGDIVTIELPQSE